MASEPISVEVEGNGATEKQRFAEHKVYTRKAFRGSRNKPTINTTTEINAIPTPARAVSDAAAASTNDTKNEEENGNITSATLTSNFNLDSNSRKEPQPVTEDVNLTMVQPVSMSVVVSDDSSSLNHQQVAGPRPQDLPSDNGLINTGVEGQTMASSSLKSKQDMRVFRHKLETELGIIRSWVKRIEEKQGKLSGYGHSHASIEGADGNAASNLSRSEVASVGVPRKFSRPLHHLRVSVFDHSHGLSDSLEKEKRTPKANQFYRNSEFLLAKDKFPPAESNKKSKLNGKKQSGELGLAHGMGSKFFKSCSSLLEKLMKHKHGWVFNTPVDVEDLGLHDYYIIIKHPMDLGTVKTRLTKNWYKSPKEFAEDIRLTFRNAMTYNPKGQDVHVMAEQLSKIFEERWVIIESDYNREMRLGLDYGVALSTPTSRKAHLPRPPPLDMRRIFDRSESVAHPVDSIQKAITVTVTPSSRTPAPKKPKAKDPHKRDMTYEEKQKLSTKLQSLPSERLDAVVQIIKKRNSALFQHDEEIEVDIDSVDAETLWELDRFVTNYKKSLSKKKRKAELAIQASQARASTEHKVQGKTMAPVVADVPKENKADENVVSSVSPFQGKKQADDRSRSSSSSSSSSDSETSSSDSDSESTSASGSDIGAPTT